MIKKNLAVLKNPSPKSLGVLLGGGFIVGILFWGGFNTAMEMTNTEEFCISCHEMKPMYDTWLKGPHGPLGNKQVL